jgi:transketolase
VKVILTHVGLDVGEDGKTHQCIDYVGLANNMFGFKLIVPADPNQTYKAINYVANQKGNYLISMGRSKLDIIRDESGEIFFTKDYEYGKADVIREGKDACIFVMGALVNRAIQIADALKKDGINVRLVNISSPLEIDRAVIVEAAQTGLIVTIEDHNVKTGLGAIISQRIVEEGAFCPLVKYGVGRYACSGSADDVYRLMGLDFDTLLKNIKGLINEK